jgi:N-acetyl sugar amidotransferase
MNKKVCTRCIMDDEGDQTIAFDSDGTCNYCRDTLGRKDSEYFPNEEGKRKLNAIMEKIKETGKGQVYDCMVGVSGGVDSSYIIYLGFIYGLRMLAVHIDDGFDTDIAMSNIRNLCTKAKVELIIVKPDKEQFADVIGSFFMASVPSVAISQDSILMAALNDVGKKYNLKYNLSGGNFALESILQRGQDNINYADKKHIEAIHKLFGKGKIDKLRLISFYEKYIVAKYFNKVKKILPLNYIDYNLESVLQELSDFCGYNYYGGKHYESILTRFLQCYYLPTKYDFDKRKSHFSSMIVSNQMSREEALERISKPAYITEELKESDFNFIADYLCMSRVEFDQLVALLPKKHTDYTISNINKFAGVARKLRRYLGE